MRKCPNPKICAKIQFVIGLNHRTYIMFRGLNIFMIIIYVSVVSLSYQENIERLSNFLDFQDILYEDRHPVFDGGGCGHV